MFQDFFRDALEASLEASSKSRTLSARQPSLTGEYKVELNFELPPVKEENEPCEESSSSSPSCLNCVRLQRRIMELQEKLSRLTGEQEDMEASPVLNKALRQPDQDLQSPETVHTEEAEPECKFQEIKDRNDLVCQNVKDKSQPVFLFDSFTKTFEYFPIMCLFYINVKQQCQWAITWACQRNSATSTELDLHL